MELHGVINEILINETKSLKDMVQVGICLYEQSNNINQYQYSSYYIQWS